MSILLLAMAACAGATTETAAPAPQTAAVDTMAEEADMAAGEETTESMDDSPHDAMADEDMADEDMADDNMAADESMAEESMTDDSMSDDTMADDDMMADDMATLAAWQTLPLTNARTGETFTLGDYAGQTVFVEPMATWCSNCRQQLTNVQQARTQLNSDDVVFIALSVETTISDEELARYADDLGFDWTFAVMTPEVLQALAEQFGRTVSNPPSTPHFVIRADGSASELVTGIQSAEEIAALTAN
jgi:cytochrome oxidase Cu insertion factor (SCO1/SenC/PrrC family)